jgi:hypothetical protein
MSAKLLSTVAALCLIGTACGGGSDQATAVEDIAPTSEKSGDGDGESSSLGQTDTEVDAGDGDGDGDGDDSATGQIGSSVDRQVAGNLDVAFPPTIEACVVAAVAEDEVLLAGVLDASGFSDLPVDQQVTVVGLALDCADPGALSAYMLETFNQDAAFVVPASVGDCLEAKMTGENRNEVLLGFIAMGQLADGEGDGVPASARGPLIDTLTECFPGDVFADAVMVSAAEDPTLADAFDADCLSTAFDDPSVTAPLWTSVVDNPDLGFEEMDTTTQAAIVGPIAECISFGAAIAASAEADGVTLSDDSIACIDSELADADFLGQILASDGDTGQLDEESIGLAILGCLTSAELESMLGG